MAAGDETAASVPIAAPGATAATARGRSRRTGDLEARPFPEIRTHDAAARRDALVSLRTWAEQSAEDAIEWYMDNRRSKRIACRTLQGLAIAFAVAGTAVPLGTAAAGSGSGQGWGYVLLAVAAGCKGFDHFFGLSAGWMRDMATANALRGELDAVRLEWAREALRAGPAAAAAAAAAATPPNPAAADPAPSDPAVPAPAVPDPALEAAELERQLALVMRLAEAVREHVTSEVAAWQADFTASTRQLHEQAGLP